MSKGLNIGKKNFAYLRELRHDYEAQDTGETLDAFVEALQVISAAEGKGHDALYRLIAEVVDEDIIQEKTEREESERVERKVARRQARRKEFQAAVDHAVGSKRDNILLSLRAAARSENNAGSRLRANEDPNAVRYFARSSAFLDAADYIQGVLV